MGGIHEEHVEWAVVNRLKAMLDQPPETDFNVTLGFSLFSTVLLWTKNRMWVQNPVLPADDHAAAARFQLGQARIIDPPWNLSQAGPVDHGAGVVNDDFVGMSAADFFVWLRNALAHGDGRSIKPLHWHSAATGKEWLGGFRIEFNRTNGSADVLTLHLFKQDMQHLGQQLADLFCKSLAQGDDYHFSDAATKAIGEADADAVIEAG